MLLRSVDLCDLNPELTRGRRTCQAARARRPGYALEQKAASALSLTRIELSIRACASSPRLPNAYTIAVLALKRSATSPTVNSRSTARGPARSLSDPLLQHRLCRLPELQAPSG